MSRISGKELTTFQVAPDGGTFCLNFKDDEGRAGGLSLPVECINALLMTLPRIMSQALRAKYGDASIRMVHPIGGWKIEAAAGDTRLILTLKTPDAFEVSFALAVDDLATMLRTATNSSAANVAKPTFN